MLAVRTLAAVALVLLLAPAASGEQARRVLFLHSYGPHFSPFNTFAQEMREDLVRLAPRPLDIYEASLETARFAEPDVDAAPFVRYLLTLFEERPPDLVVAVGAPAARFAQAYRRPLFPSAPLLLTALEERTVDREALTSNDSVVAVRLNVPATIENILQVLPGTKRLLVVLGDSPLEQRWRQMLEEELEPLKPRVQVEWLEPLGFDDILTHVAALPSDSAILYGLMFVDGDGVPHEEDQALAAVGASASVPMFGLFDNQLGKGIVGGTLLPVESLAAEAADIALKLLEGAPAAEFRPEPLSPDAPAYDARQLARWGVSEATLSPGSRIAFREPTAWQRYHWQILAIAGAFAIEGGFIVALLVNRRWLHRSRTALRDLTGRLIHAQEDERARLARELHDDTTQRLAMLAISAGQGERAAGGGEKSTLWAEMREELARLSDDVHALSYRLHPSILVDLGLAEALRSECKRFARIEEIAVATNIREVPDGLPGGTALGLFRIAQEALRNVARHAGASRVEVALGSDGAMLVLQVADDGCGFDARPGLTRGLGLASIRQRAALIGGELDVRSDAAGTSLRVSVPIDGGKE